MLRSALVIVGLMVVLGWPSLSMPFRGDEALFALMARETSRGAVLYRDYWDITNPGIFWFYRCGGTFFGFSEDGIRVFEWLYITSFIFIFTALIRKTYQLPRLPLMPAILIGGAYYMAGYSNTSHLTKTEGLATFPLVLAMGLPFVVRSSNRVSWQWLFIAGIAGGIVILFKLLLVVCLSVCWGFWFFKCLSDSGWKSMVSSALVVGCGCLVVLAPAFAHFYSHGMMDTLVRTLVELPPQFLAEGERADFKRLAFSVRWFLEQYAPILALAILGGCARWQQRKDRVLVGFVLLIVSAFVVILAQRLSWWSYHFLLLGGPISVLAAYGWPALQEWANARFRTPLTLIERSLSLYSAATLCLPAVTGGGNQVMQLASRRLGWSSQDRESCRAATGNAYRLAKDEAEWLKQSQTKPGRIYVCGDPLIYWFSDRLPAVPISGWSLQMYPASVRNEVIESIRTQRPVHIFITTGNLGFEPLIAEKYTPILQILQDHYVLSHTSPTGKWYTLRDDVPLND